jgi:adenosine/AMP kinase
MEGKISAVQINIPENANIIFGQSHFIKQLRIFLRYLSAASPD